VAAPFAGVVATGGLIIRNRSLKGKELEI